MHIPHRRTTALGLAPLLIAGLASCGLLSDSGDSDGTSKNAADSTPVVGRDPASAGPQSTTAPPATAEPGTEISVAFAGDVHFFERTVPRLNAGPEGALGPIGKTLADADLAMVNLESAITERGTPENKTYHFRAPAKALNELQAVGVDVVSMANNHAVDYGKVGLEDSVAALEKAPIGVVGLGKDAERAYRPFIKNVKGVKVAFLAASQVQDITNQLYRAGAGKPGIATALQTDRLVKAVRDAKAQADVIVVYMHWGIEGDKCPSADQKSVARKLADAGADAILGTHAHVMQGAGWLGDTYVGYGYGNFLWYGTSPYPNSNDTGVATLRIKDGKVVGEKFTPASIDNRGVPMPVTGAESKRILDRRDTLRPCTGLTATPKK
ncbi:CapA family protein [Embleya sp. NBC_00896]|uniref:CapA family protein n=1 Tax=Embleya sp. NBC_00896 TaxID=2975961 RepID=UPI0038678537|nr:CapA family protein [Embleya sp. NBC_00896]